MTNALIEVFECSIPDVLDLCFSLLIGGKSLDGDEDNDGDYMNAVSHGHSKASSIFKSKKSKASL